MQGRTANAIRAARKRLDESLFPSAPSGTTTLGRGESVTLVLAFLALAMILQVFRAGPTYAINGLWAEDGAVFVQGAISHGFVDAVTSTYAGYLVVVPRLIGELGVLVPLRDTAATVAILSTALVALSGLVVWFASAGHIRNPYLRGALAALTVVTPVASLEAISSASYVSWYLLFATFWILLWRPKTAWGTGLASLFVLATWLSSPGVLFFAPVAALRAFVGRDRRDLTIVGAYVLGAAIQLPVVASSNESTVEPLWNNDIWVTYLQRVIDGAALGEHLGGGAWASFGWPFLIALLAAAIVGLVVGVVQARSTARYLALIAIPTSLVMFLVSIYQRAAAPAMVWPEGIHFGPGSRYAIVPALLLVSVALALVDRRARRQERRRAPWAAAAAVVVLLVGVVTSFDLHDSVARGTPSWSESLDAAATACVGKRLSEVTIETSPPGFGVTVPCDLVTSADSAPAAR
jgi:hypothetical protein